MGSMTCGSMVVMAVDGVRGRGSLEGMCVVIMALQLYVEEWAQLKMDEYG